MALQTDQVNSAAPEGALTSPGADAVTIAQARHAPGRHSSFLTALLLLMATLLGAWAFLYPFFIPQTGGEEAGSHSADAPLIFLLVMVLCLGAILADLETRAMDSKTVALLGVLVATNSLLRPVQGPGGSSLVYLLPILCGYVFGPTFGFLMGSLSLVVSALFTGGVGPWLPFQMLAVGWVGLASGLLPARRISNLWRGRAEKWLLAGWGGIVGIAFGAVMNLWFWPFLTSASGYEPGQVRQPGAGLADALQRYIAFYLTTSLPYDLGRSIGNILLLLFLGPPVLRLLRRYKQRFFFNVR